MRIERKSETTTEKFHDPQTLFQESVPIPNFTSSVTLIDFILNQSNGV